MTDTRKSTNRLLEMVENGSIDPKDVVMMCVKFMSEDDVDEMCRINEVFYDDEDDEDYSDYSEYELRKMGCFDNLNEEDEEDED